MTLNEFVKIKNRAKEDISFTDENYHMKTIEIPRLLQFYTNACLNERRTYSHYEEEKSRVYKKIYNYYKFDAPCEWSNQTELKIQAEGDEDYLKVVRELEFLQLKVEFLDSCVKNIQTMSYSLRQYHDIKLFKNGMIK